MDIKLNNNDIHAAIRGFLQERNIVDSYTELNISFTMSRGANPGASAEVTIVDTADSTSTTTEPSKSTGGIFNDAGSE
jgi:hypothetical protein